MNKQIEAKKNNENGLNPPSKTLIKIYGILAILLVIIPEWLAEVTLGIENRSHNSGLPKKDIVWKTNPELRISIMSIKELREFAMQLKIRGYARENKDLLKIRILKKMKKNKTVLEKLVQNIQHLR